MTQHISVAGRRLGEAAATLSRVAALLRNHGHIRGHTESGQPRVEAGIGALIEALEHAGNECAVSLSARASELTLAQKSFGDLDVRLADATGG